MFPDYPYTDGHQLNLDWLVTNLTELKTALDEGQLVGPAGENGESAFIDSIVMKYAFVPYNTTPLPTVWFNTVGLAEAAYGRDISGAILCTKIQINCHTGNTYYSRVVHSRTYQGKDGVPSVTDIQNAVDEYLTTHPTVTGTFTNAAKHALISLLEKVAYIDEHGQEYLDTLETELFTMAVASISAVFNSGTNVIYTDDTLDSLKQYLTVTATYADSTTEVLADSVYTLSGTLTDGPNTITVSYDGKTTTFNVTATRYRLYDYIYNTGTGQGNNGYVNTGLTHSPSFNTLNIEFEAMNSRNTTGNDPLICANNQNASDTGNIVWYARANKAGFSAYNLGVAKQLTMVPGDTRAIIKYFFVDGGESYLEWAGNTEPVATMSKSSVATNSNTLILAGGRSFSTGLPYNMSNLSKLGYVKFTDPATETVLYHFIPAHDLIEDKWGFYEQVNEIFYPSNNNYLRCANWEA